MYVKHALSYHYNETLLPNGGSGASGPRKTLFGGGARGGKAAPRTPTEDGIWKASPSRPHNSRCNTVTNQQNGHEQTRGRNTAAATGQTHPWPPVENQA